VLLLLARHWCQHSYIVLVLNPMWSCTMWMLSCCLQCAAMPDRSCHGSNGAGHQGPLGDDRPIEWFILLVHQLLDFQPSGAEYMLMLILWVGIAARDN